MLCKYYFDKELDAENRKKSRKSNPLLTNNQKQNNKAVLEKKSETITATEVRFCIQTTV